MKVSRTIVAIGLMAMTVMLTSYTVVQVRTKQKRCLSVSMSIYLFLIS